MKTTELIPLIGEPLVSIIIKDRYGNATFHARGFWSCDPCYLPEELNQAISAAHVQQYPWNQRDHRQHCAHWMPFQVRGHACWARSCGDGTGYFGNSVDAGWVVVFPSALAPAEMNQRIHLWRS